MINKFGKLYPTTKPFKTFVKPSNQKEESVAPMDYTVDMSCVMKVNRNCELCRQKVTELMHSVNVVYSVDFVGEDNTIKLKARANPNRVLAVIERYGDHGKISNLRFDGEVMTFRPGGGYYGQSGYYLPSNAAANNPYPSSYPHPPQLYAGNHPCHMSNPLKQSDAPRKMNNQHTAPPNYTKPLPSRPLQSYSYIEPPYWPSSSGGRCCLIM